MELRFNNLKLTSLAFPTRKLRNKSEKNWRNFEEQRVSLEMVDTSLDGSTGDVTIKCRVPDYFSEAVRDGKVVTKGIIFPNQTDSEIEDLLDFSAQQKLGGKRWQDADPIELLETGLVQL